MSIARNLAALTALSLALGLGAFAPACGGLKSATSACTERCDKAETCGDIDSVNAQQCRNKCDANAEVADAYLELCLNKSDILSAESECLGRACTDYAACLSTVPACKATGYTTTYTGTHTYTSTGGGGLACDAMSGTTHECIQYTSSTGGATCPSGSTQVVACSTGNLLGVCSLNAASGSGAVYYYAGGAITASQASQACSAAGGTWAG
jgi:hypothetical protein